MQKRLFWLFILGLGPAVWLQAQVSPSTGAIQGSVVDQTGAVVPGASVTLTSKSLSLTRDTKTQQDGTYLFPLVPPTDGYEVAVSAQGFRKEVLTDLTVRVTETTVANVKLQLGATAEEVSVRADAQAVQTTSATLGAVVQAMATQLGITLAY